MDAEVRISADDEIAETISLIQWLSGQRELHGRVQAIHRAPGPEELGGAIEFATVALGAGGTGMALARALIAWLNSRRSDITVTVTTEAGTVSIDAKRVTDPMSLLRQVLEHKITDDDRA
jgi:hypothetical protein